MCNLAESLFLGDLLPPRGGPCRTAEAVAGKRSDGVAGSGVLLTKGLVMETGSPAANRERRPALMQMNPRLA